MIICVAMFDVYLLFRCTLCESWLCLFDIKIVIKMTMRNLHLKLIDNFPFQENLFVSSSRHRL